MKVETLSLGAVDQSPISWQDWCFTRQQGNGKPFLKRSRLHIIVIEPSQYMSTQISILIYQFWIDECNCC